MCLYPYHSTGMLWVTNASDCVDGIWVCLFWRMLIKTYGWVESSRWTAMRSICRVHRDYGQNIVLSTGNFLCSAPSVNSTMDFSKKRVEDGVVDSPIEKKVKVAVEKSTSSLPAKEWKATTMSISNVVRLK